MYELADLICDTAHNIQLLFINFVHGSTLNAIDIYYPVEPSMILYAYRTMVLVMVKEALFNNKTEHIYPNTTLTQNTVLKQLCQPFLFTGKVHAISYSRPIGQF